MNFFKTGIAMFTFLPCSDEQNTPKRHIYQRGQRVLRTTLCSLPFRFLSLFVIYIITLPLCLSSTSYMTLLIYSPANLCTIRRHQEARSIILSTQLTTKTDKNASLARWCHVASSICSIWEEPKNVLSEITTFLKSSTGYLYTDHFSLK